MSERQGSLKTKFTTAVDELQLSYLSITDQSEDWGEKYDGLDDVQKRDLYLGTFKKIEENFKTIDISRLKEFIKTISLLNKRETNKILLKTFDEDNENPFKITNLIMLACKHNRIDILEYILAEEIEILDNLSSVIGCNQIDKGDNGSRTAFYYAIRSNNVRLLETLLKFEKPLHACYKMLSSDYEVLKLYNVEISENMQIFVEDRLIRGLYEREILNASNCAPSETANIGDASTSTQNNTANTSRPEFEIYKRFNLIINASKELDKMVSCPYVENLRATIALSIARNIQVLKRQLKPTNSQLPWEEMEFCLSQYLCLSTVEGKRIQRHLMEFINKLKTVFRITDGSGNTESEVLREIQTHMKGRYGSRDIPISGFETLYDDYESIKDVYSLKKMLNYIQLALQASPDKQSERLLIYRALQVIGEYVKNSAESPHLSESTQETFNNYFMGSFIDVVPSLRDILSHTDTLHALILRNGMESKQAAFEKIKVVLERVRSVIVSVFHSVKVKHFKKWCEAIIYEDNPDELKESCSRFVEYLRENELPDVKNPEQNALNELINLMRKKQKFADEKINTEIHDLREIVQSEYTEISNRIMEWNKLFKETEEMLSRHSENCRVIHLNKMSLKYYSCELDMMFSGLNSTDVLCAVSDWMDKMSEYTEVSELCVDMAKVLSSIVRPTTEIEEFKEELVLLETDPSVQDNIQLELDEEFIALESVLSEEKFRKLLSSLEKKKIINRITLKVKENKPLEKSELVLLNEQLNPKKADYKKILLEKTKDYYGEFLAEKIDFKNFAGSFQSDSTPRLITIYKEIKSKNGNCTAKNVDETILRIKDELQKEQYDVLTNKWKTMKQNHESRDKLIYFFSSSNILEGEEYGKLVDALDSKPNIKANLNKLYELDDTYGILVKAKQKYKSEAEKWTAYGKFISSLHLDSETTLIKQTIMNNTILMTLKDQFSKTLILLKNELGNIETRETRLNLILRYKSDLKLQATVEMLLLDLCNMSTMAQSLKFMTTTSEISLQSLWKAFLYVEGNLMFLKVDSLRNYLAHGDALIDALPFDSSIAVISCAILFSENGEPLMPQKQIAKPNRLLTKNPISNLIKGSLVETNVCSCYEQYLNQCVSQVSLFTAASQGDKQEIESLIKSGKEIYSRDSRMRSLLHIAANEGCEDIMKVLLKNGIDVDTFDKHRRTALHLAARNDHCRVVQMLLNNGATFNAVDANACSSLHAATLSQVSKEVARTLLVAGIEKGINIVNISNRFKFTPLHNAARVGNFDVVKLLVEEFKADVTVEDDEGNKPLHMAAGGIHNNADVFKYLLSKNRDGINQDVSLTLLQLAIEADNDNVIEAIFGGIATSTLSENAMDSLLRKAVRNGNVKIVQILSGNNVNLNAVSPNGLTLLHLASAHGRSCVVEFLLNNKTGEANVAENQKQNMEAHGKGVIPLHLAAMSGNLETVKFLVGSGHSNVNKKAKHYSTPLHFAVLFNHINIVEYLVKEKADYDAPSRTSLSLLHVWTQTDSKDLKMADYLINDLKVDIDSPDDNNFTPLANLVKDGTLRAIKYLVDNNANTDIRNRDRETLLHLAAKRGNLNIFKYLIEKMRNNINAVDAFGYNVLHHAAARGYKKMVDALLKMKKDEDFVNACGNVNHYTPLYCAVFKGHIAVVKTLLEYGADVNGKSNPHFSPLDSAVKNGFEKMVKLLLMKGADVSPKRASGKTSLMTAAFYGKPEILEILLDKDAEGVDYKDITNRTALHYATCNSHKKCIEILLCYGADPNLIGTFPLILIAASNCENDIIEILLNGGADINFLKKFGITGMQRAADGNYYFKCSDVSDYDVTGNGVVQQVLKKKKKKKKARKMNMKSYTANRKKGDTSRNNTLEENILGLHEWVDDRSLDALLAVLKTETGFDTLSTLLIQIPEEITPMYLKDIQILGGQQSGHWHCAYFDGVDLHIYDSKYYEQHTYKDLEENEKEYIRRRWPKLNNVIFEKVQEQPDDNSCGIYAAAFATTLALRGDPSYETYSKDIKIMREHFLKIIRNQFIIPFPTLY